MHLTSDVLASLVMGAGCVVLLLGYLTVGARIRYRRVLQQGDSFVIGFNLMHAGYWLLQPLVRLCSRHGISPAAISWFSLVPAVTAAVAAAFGHWGYAAWCLLASALLDVLDGAVARETGHASPAGAVLDSVLDRYAEFIFFAGLFIYYRDDLPAQLLVLAAVLGSFLVTYSTAKAEALHLTPPRGSMKRSDRLTVLVLGTALAPLSQTWLESNRPRIAWPVLGALLLIGLLANLSAVRRFTALAQMARAADAPQPPADAPAAASRPAFTHRSVQEVATSTPRGGGR